MTKDKSKLIDRDGPWYYEMHHIGYNYRLTDFQCALGINQLKKLDSFIKKRRDLALKYDAAFKDNTLLQIPSYSPHMVSIYHLYPLLINFKKLKKTRSDFFSYMKKRCNSTSAFSNYQATFLQK